MELTDKEKYLAGLVIKLIDNVECPMLMYEGEKNIVKKALLNILGNGEEQ
jgi:hypothetical protein